MAIILVAVVLVLTAVTVFAQPFGKDREHLRPFVEPIIIGHGFAMKGDEYHILDINAIRMGDTSPGFIRSLLWQKKSPEEIAKEILNNSQATTTRAHLRFAGETYSLNITAYDNLSLTGDILTLPRSGNTQSSFTPATVGHISLSVKEFEGDMLSIGTLTMNGTDYRVLLTSPTKMRRW